MPIIYCTDIASEADLQVYRAMVRSEAALVVFETQNRWDATTAPIWAYTDIASDADHVVFICDNPWDAHLIIYGTDIRSDAGWQNADKQHLL